MSVRSVIESLSFRRTEFLFFFVSQCKVSFFQTVRSPFKSHFVIHPDFTSENLKHRKPVSHMITHFRYWISATTSGLAFSYAVYCREQEEKCAPAGAGRLLLRDVNTLSAALTSICKCWCFYLFWMCLFVALVKPPFLNNAKINSSTRLFWGMRRVCRFDSVEFIHHSPMFGSNLRRKISIVFVARLQAGKLVNALSSALPCGVWFKQWALHFYLFITRFCANMLA